MRDARAAGSAHVSLQRHERRAARARDQSEKTFVSVSIIPFARASHQLAALYASAIIHIRQQGGTGYLSGWSAARRAARVRDRSEKTFVSVSIIPFARASHQHALRHPL
jgi:hypothetical protein